MMIRLVALFSFVPSLAAQVALTHVGSLDVSSTANSAGANFIGSHPSAVAWNGADLWLAGFNNTAATADVAIVKVSSPLASATYGVPFGVQSTTMSRGYSGLDVNDLVLAAAYDPGFSNPHGITGWAVVGGPLWSKMGRGSSGVALDPGAAGLGSGVGWTYIGSGRRLLQDALTGTDIYTPSNGMFLIAGIAAFWRDMDFDTQTGDVYLRKGNQVIYVERLGPNAGAIPQVLVPSSQADFIPVQNLAFVRQTDASFVIWNDRTSTLPGQSFANVVQAARASDGSPLSIDFRGFTASAGSGAYDFSYDEASATLAVCDFENREVHIFAVSSFLSFGAGCAGAGGIVPKLAATGDTRPGGTVIYSAEDLAPSSIGLFVFGTTQGSVALPPPFSPNCPLVALPAALVVGAFVTGAGQPGSGSGSMTVPLPVQGSGLAITCQVAVLEAGDVATTRMSNGVQATMH